MGRVCSKPEGSALPVSNSCELSMCHDYQSIPQRCKVPWVHLRRSTGVYEDTVRTKPPSVCTPTHLGRSHHHSFCNMTAPGVPEHSERAADHLPRAFINSKLSDSMSGASMSAGTLQQAIHLSCTCECCTSITVSRSLSWIRHTLGTGLF